MNVCTFSFLLVPHLEFLSILSLCKLKSIYNLISWWSPSSCLHAQQCHIDTWAHMKKKTHIKAKKQKGNKAIIKKCSYGEHLKLINRNKYVYK